MSAASVLAVYLQSGTSVLDIAHALIFFPLLQVKDVLFEPVRKTQDAMHFMVVNTSEGEMWVPCGPRQAGAIETTMQELAMRGLASKVIFSPTDEFFCEAETRYVYLIYRFALKILY